MAKATCMSTQSWTIFWPFTPGIPQLEALHYTRDIAVQVFSVPTGAMKLNT
jgi:hypothetical protein